MNPTAVVTLSAVRCGDREPARSQLIGDTSAAANLPNQPLYAPAAPSTPFQLRAHRRWTDHKLLLIIEHRRS